MASFLRYLEPYLRRVSCQVLAPWKGNLVARSDLSRTIIPWGFLSQRQIREWVTPFRGGRGDVEVERRAAELALDVEELLEGSKFAYQAVTDLFSSPRPPPPAAAAAGLCPSGQGERRAPFTAPTAGEAGEDRGGDGISRQQSCVDGGGDSCPHAGGRGAAGDGGAGSATVALAPAPTDFLELEMTSPQLSLFLNDVLDSYRRRRLVPRMAVSGVEARLCKLGVRLGGLRRNRHFLGLMSKEEAKYHLTMGVVGPEGVVINELEGRAPQRVIADVELLCEEDFVLEDEEGREVHRSPLGRKQVHYLTLQSDLGPNQLEWQVTNINDVIKPNIHYYFGRYGH